MNTLILVAALLAAGADLPDSATTPGAVNAAVSQETIKSTICVSGWTKTIRPPASYTNKLKASQLAAGPYKSSAALSDFEEDHLISLEIGGNPTDPRNLWPEHWSAPYGAHQKDQLENYLHRAVCAGTMTLADAQQAMRSNWVAAYDRYITKKGKP